MSILKQRPQISYNTSQKIANVIEGRYVVHLIAVIAACTVLIPLVWAFLTSLKSPGGVYSLTYLPHEPTIQNYYTVLVVDEFWKAIRNTLIIATSTTIVVLLLAVPAGYGFSRFRFPFDNTIFIGIIFSRLFPPIGLAVPYFQLMSWFNLLDTRVGVIIANTYLWLPLMIYIMRNFFISIPEELDESALVDGCTRFQAFRLIALPVAAPGIAACAILTFLYSWREFLFALIVTDSLEAMPVSLAVFRFVSDATIQWELITAAAILGILPTIAVVVFFQQYIIHGLSSGGIKG